MDASVVKKPQLARARDLFCVPVKHNPNYRGVAHARGIWPFKTVIVGKTWFMLPVHEQEAVLAHETGHCERLHMEARWLLLLFCWTKWAQRIAQDHEFAADAYAVRHGHGYGMLRFLERAVRAQEVANEAPGDEFIPRAAERVRRVLQLLQERHR